MPKNKRKEKKKQIKMSLAQFTSAVGVKKETYGLPTGPSCLPSDSSSKLNIDDKKNWRGSRVPNSSEEKKEEKKEESKADNDMNWRKAQPKKTTNSRFSRFSSRNKFGSQRDENSNSFGSFRYNKNERQLNGGRQLNGDRQLNGGRRFHRRELTGQEKFEKALSEKRDAQEKEEERKKRRKNRKKKKPKVSPENFMINEVTEEDREAIRVALRRMEEEEAREEEEFRRLVAENAELYGDPENDEDNSGNNIEDNSGNNIEDYSEYNFINTQQSSTLYCNGREVRNNW